MPNQSALQTAVAPATVDQVSSQVLELNCLANCNSSFGVAYTGRDNITGPSQSK